MTVYIELIFLDNFLLDSLLLWLVSRFTSKTKLVRILSVAVIGGIYALTASFFKFLSVPFCKILIGFLMTAICFPRNAAKSFLFFSVFSMLLGGIAFALDSPAETFGSNERLLIISSLIIILLTELLCKTNFAPSASITVEAVFNDRSLIFTAEYDSGCTVKDQRGKAVILIDKNYFITNINTDVFHKNKTHKFFISTVSGTKELIGIKPKNIILKDQYRRYRADAWLVIADEICLNGSPAIFGKGLITESEENQCRHFSESAFSGLSHCFKRITAIMSTAANRCLRRSQKKKNPPS